ncbi:MAG: CDGSH iron-sulfur domain-containing protein [Dehalococcoidia bacterium]|nr:CDGSH iron-sulfur domain-containing protein [Dehalococcoidia bacterium]
MAEVIIKVRANGSLRIEGPVKLVDDDGREFTLPGAQFALCRCGQSQNKPFCDSSHKTCGFQPNTKAPQQQGVETRP